MLVRVLIGVGGLAVGCAAGVYFGGHFRAATDEVVSPSRPAENEAVVELRVRVPVTASRPGVAARPNWALVNTGNPLDLAVEGSGYFQVTLPNGELRYTRDGSLRLNAVGNLVTADGYLISPQLTIPQTAVSISCGSDGTISVQTAGATNVSTQVGQLTLARFANDGGLTADGLDLFAESQASGCPALSTPGLNGTGQIRQGFRERRAEHLAAALADLVQQIADEERRNGAVSGVTRTR